MKRLRFFTFSCILLFIFAACSEKAERDIPAPKPPEEEPAVGPETPDGPGESETPVYPVDVRDAFEKAGLVSTVKSCDHYSPHSGVDVTEIRYTDYAAKPQAVFVMQVDLSDPTVSMTNTVPGGATTSFSAGRERLTAQCKRIDTADHWVVGAVNTDFFNTSTGSKSGEAQSAFWHNGICLKNTFTSDSRPRCFVYWGDDETVRLGKSSEYSEVKAHASFKELFSGGQYLVEKGKATAFVQDAVYGVHPRTMFGVCSDPRKVVMVVLDGRNEVLAVGMNYPDMQKILLALECQTALNIDGGGSSTFVVRKISSTVTGYGDKAPLYVRNMPSDGSERAIGPGLAIVAND